MPRFARVARTLRGEHGASMGSWAHICRRLLRSALPTSADSVPRGISPRRTALSSPVGASWSVATRACGCGASVSGWADGEWQRARLRGPTRLCKQSAHIGGCVAGGGGGCGGGATSVLQRGEPSAPRAERLCQAESPARPPPLRQAPLRCSDGRAAARAPARSLDPAVGALAGRREDTDGNGKLSFSELCAACRRMGAPPRPRWEGSPASTAEGGGGGAERRARPGLAGAARVWGGSTGSRGGRNEWLWRPHSSRPYDVGPGPGSWSCVAARGLWSLILASKVAGVPVHAAAITFLTSPSRSKNPSYMLQVRWEWYIVLRCNCQARGARSASDVHILKSQALFSAVFNQLFVDVSLDGKASCLWCSPLKPRSLQHSLYRSAAGCDVSGPRWDCMSLISYIFPC